MKRLIVVVNGKEDFIKDLYREIKELLKQFNSKVNYEIEILNT